MRKITSIIATVLMVSAGYAQNTFELDWEQGVNGASASFTVEIGDTVRWTWANGAPHSVTSQPGSAQVFDSGVITGMGTEYEVTFVTDGENTYLCEVHPGSMFGTITVEPELSVQDKFERNVKFYPNPVDDELTIASLYRLDAYEIYTITGKKVGQGAGEGTYTHLNTSYLESGVYFVKVTSEGLTATLRLIKR
ncbi:MAG: T9SS type A sorting domain-containing protein [Flavobacteriales bacterium]|jgi:plastocyanin|nr:T9SS type A sorting domain-containing protein [Flavobacteriales bacterium]